MTDILKLLEPAGENATDDIIRQIRFLLDSGDLQPGDKLPAERKLAEKFQVARSQVREAFKKLEFYNIIKTMPQSGSVISAIESTALNSLISDILKMDNCDFHSLVEARSIIEINAAKLCAIRRTEEDLKMIESAMNNYNKKIKEMKKLFLTLALVLGVSIANAQFFIGGQFGITHDDAKDNTTFTIAPEFGYAFNDMWTVAGMIGYTHMDNYNSFYIAPYARWTFFKRDFLSLLVDGGLGFSTGKYKGADSVNGFEIGFKPGISFNLTDNFALVAHYGFLGYRDKYNGNSVSGLSLKGNELSFSLYYCF